MANVRRLSAIVGGGYTEYWRCKKRYRVLKGGKASKKSTTTALWIIANMMKPEYREANTLVVRRVMDTHRKSTFAELQKAMERLGVSHLWKSTVSPMEMTYLPTGQKILFAGFDNVLKLASTTVARGVLCWVWVEEAFEIESEADFDKLDLSVPRGQVTAPLFKQTTLTFNPWNENHWLKARFFDRHDPQVLAMTTDYRCNEFLDDTDRQLYEDMRINHPRKYAVMGLGEWGVSSGQIFENWIVEEFDVKTIVAQKPWQWRHVFGLDFGYSNDPTAFVAAAVNPIAHEIYIYDEWCATGMLNTDIARMIIGKSYQKERIRCDAAESKSIAELKQFGVHRACAAVKGPDSVRNGIGYLQEYRMIVHPSCKHTAGELATYCWKVAKDGRVQNEAEDRNNHLMDALRYAVASPEIKNFHPSVDKPPRPRPSRDGITAADFRGGWR